MLWWGRNRCLKCTLILALLGLRHTLSAPPDSISAVLSSDIACMIPSYDYLPGHRNSSKSVSTSTAFINDYDKNKFWSIKMKRRGERESNHFLLRELREFGIFFQNKFKAIYDKFIVRQIQTSGISTAGFLALLLWIYGGWRHESLLASSVLEVRPANNVT